MAAERSQIGVSDVEELERRARWQRAQLREHISDLKFGLQQTLDGKRLVRQYFWQSLCTVSLIGLLAGYSFAGIFSRE